MHAMSTQQLLFGHKFVWQLPQYDQQKITSLASAFNISFPIAHTLITRGYDSPQAVQQFLFSSFEQDVAHPSLLKDAQKSIERIMFAIEHKQRILIFGDYDVDGITSSALMMICLLPLGAQVNFFLPHRVRDGYGLSTKIVERAAQNGYNLIITVDNGITAFEPAQKARKCGVDLIITDHHRPHEQVPDAFAIVNPNQKDCPYPFKTLAGVGVTFKLMSLLYELKQMTMPPKAYELLLLGTIADVVPLLGENRFWVRYGLAHVNRFESISLKTLKQNSKVEKTRLSATDIGFSIAPQINALGRLEDPRQGVKFLIGSDETEVAEVGRILFELNETRKGIERSIVQEIEQRIASKEIDLDTDKVIITASSKWPPGVIGLVASRIVSKYGRPTILLHTTDKGIAKGSCRSIPEFNLFNGLKRCEQLLIQFGGHSQAAGLSLKTDSIPALKDALNKIIGEELTEFDLKQKIAIDASVSLGDLTKKFVEDLGHLEPFGNENREPLFYMPDVCLVQKPQLLKDAHVKCSVFADGVIKPVIFFNRPELYETFLALENDSFALAAQVQENHWNGRVNIELSGVDVAILKDK